MDGDVVKSQWEAVEYGVGSKARDKKITTHKRGRDAEAQTLNALANEFDVRWDKEKWEGKKWPKSCPDGFRCYNDGEGFEGEPFPYPLAREYGHTGKFIIHPSIAFCSVNCALTYDIESAKGAHCDLIRAVGYEVYGVYFTKHNEKGEQLHNASGQPIIDEQAFHPAPPRFLLKSNDVSGHGMDVSTYRKACRTHLYRLIDPPLLLADVIVAQRPVASFHSGGSSSTFAASALTTEGVIVEAEGVTEELPEESPTSTPTRTGLEGMGKPKLVRSKLALATQKKRSRGIMHVGGRNMAFTRSRSLAAIFFPQEMTKEIERTEELRRTDLAVQCTSPVLSPDLDDF